VSCQKLALSLLAAALACGPAAAKPHAASRRLPDFSGLWTPASLTPLERPDEFKTLTLTEAEAAAFEGKHRGKPPERATDDETVGGDESEWWETDVGLARIRGQIRSSAIVSPADGKRPFTAEAIAYQKAEHARRKLPPDAPESRDQAERCIEAGGGAPIENGAQTDLYELVQARDRLAIYSEYMHDVRVVRISNLAHGADLRHPPADIRLPGGDSIGWWEGATLVVESTNYRPIEVAAPNADPKADMKVVERFTRVSPTQIFYTYSLTNPARYRQTWRAELMLNATKGPIFEFACHEGNYALANMLGGARHVEGEAREAAR
jgi:hypothetical protein